MLTCYNYDLLDSNNKSLKFDYYIIELKNLKRILTKDKIKMDLMKNTTKVAKVLMNISNSKN